MKPSWLPSVELSSSLQKKDTRLEMDSLDMRAAVSSGDDNQLVKKKRDWHKRLRLRKTAIQSPTMQGQDKPGPKKIAKQRESNRDRPSSNMAPREGRQRLHKAHTSPSMLRFKCSQCNDNLEFLPKELARHFQETHKGNLPDFPCHLCSFRAHDFSYLQVHLLSHKDTFSSCSICKDNVQRPLSEYCSHLTSCHSQNGKFSCELCGKFSTGEVHMFLHHMCLHDLPVEERADVDLSRHTIDFMKPARSKASGHAFQCQYCSYKGPSKRLITKHMNTVHGGQTVNQNMKELHHIKNNPHDSAPKMRNRVTRNTARDMRWLSQDCLSLPGREFLDKYCSLSNPERTLEDTQQFLVRSAVEETGDQKWTKALQSVLSNFPQDINMHPKLENAMMSNSSKDLTVLMVKNKLKVPQNAGSYVKKTTPPEKLEISPSGSATLDTHCVFDPNRGQPQLSNDQTHCPGTQNNINEDPSITAKPESAEGGPIQENRENQELRLHQNVEGHGRNHKEIKCDHACDDGLDASKEAKAASRRDPRMPSQRKPRGRRGGRADKGRPVALEKQLQGLGLKLVLKKDPVKNKQWMSQSPLLPPDGCAAGGGSHPGPLLSLPAAETQAGQSLVDAASAESFIVSLKECGEAPETGLHGTSDSVAPQSRPQPAEELFSVTRVQRCGNGDAPPDDGGEGKPEGRIPSGEGRADDAEVSAAARGVSERDGPGVDCSTPGRKESSPVEDVNLLRNNGAIASHAAQPCIPSPGHPFQSACVHPSPPKDTGPPPSQALSNGPPTAAAAASERLWRASPRAVERTLTLTPLSPGQAVKRPRGEQPVVVLNHPDADAPQVVRLMEAVHKHRGDVQRVVLSRPTLDAIAASDATAVWGAGAPAAAAARRPPFSGPPLPGGPPAGSTVCRLGSVRERFVLKLRLRRTSRRKYRVVRAGAERTDPAVKFRCWFCGRVFLSQDIWIAHRQRHFMEWKRPNCEKAEMSPTLEKYTET